MFPDWNFQLVVHTDSVLLSDNYGPSKDLIPWLRRSGSLPVYPHLDDRIIIYVNRQTVGILPYNSEECLILQALNQTNLCETAHFWCKNDMNHMISYESKDTFDESIKKCEGSIEIQFKLCIILYFKI